jgi:transposase
LNLGAAKVWIRCAFRRIFCRTCQRFGIEDLEMFAPYQRVTRRLAHYIHALCKVLTVKEVAHHLGLNWKTVKNIDKAFLEQAYKKTDYAGLTILAVDEIAVHKGHRYMTVVLDYLTGRVVWLGKDRKAETLTRFFKGMSKTQKERLQAMVMDMWDPFISAVRQQVPHIKIVFDLFHVVSSFGKVIDKVRNDEYRKASKKDQAVFKGSKYLLLKNKENLRRPKHREQLKQLLALNETLSTVMILKDKLKHIWSFTSRAWAQKALHEWGSLARSIGHPDLSKFANMLEHYHDGILNHCDYPIHTSKLEGVNNKIKVIKRKAYGFLDEHYFKLKVLQAFDPALKHQIGS